MKKLIIAIMLLVAATALQAQEKVGISNTENYIWHGFQLYDDSFVHPGVTIDYGNLSVGTVTHAPDARVDDYDNWDTSASYLFAPEGAWLNLEGGYTYLILPTGQNIQEYQTTISIPGTISPRYTICEVLPQQSAEGQLHILGCDISLGDPEGINALVSAEVTYNDGVNPFTGQPVVRDWTHAAAGVTVNIPYGNVILQPSIYYQHVFEESVNPDENDVWYGVGLQYKF